MPTSAEEARRLGLEGLSAFGRGQVEEALDLFSRAEATRHSPVFQLYISRCLIALGREDEGRALLYQLSQEPRAPADPQAWLRARAQATSELAELGSRKTDGDSQPLAELPPNRRRREVSGQAAAAALPKDALRTRNRFSTMEKGALAAYATGAVGLVVMVVGGTLAVVLAGDIKANCPDGICPIEQLPRAEQARRLANVATAGAVTALSGAGLGTALWLWPENTPPSPQATQAASAPKPSPWEIRPVGAGLALSGRF